MVVEPATPGEQLLSAYAAGLAAVAGTPCTRRALAALPPPPGPLGLVAVGKAAAAMWQGAWAELGDRVAAGLLVTAVDHADGLRAAGGFADGRAQLFEAGHPRPDPASLAAGEALLALLSRRDVPDDWLFLFSGGGSALLEALRPGWDLAALQALNDWLLGSGLPIGRINALRRGASRIKGGGLLEALHARPGRRARVLLISDVPGDDPGVIASGPLWPADAPRAVLPAGLPSHLASRLRWTPPGLPGVVPAHQVIAGLGRALDAVADWGRGQGLAVWRHPTRLDGEVRPAARRLWRVLDRAAPGLHVWGGELTPTLPPDAGSGGRCQQLALSLALEFAGRDDLWLLAAGSDGRDGPTDAAGALVDGGTLARVLSAGIDAQHALARADSHPALRAAGALIHTGPTGSNVNDLVLALKTAPSPA